MVSGEAFLIGYERTKRINSNIKKNPIFLALPFGKSSIHFVKTWRGVSRDGEGTRPLRPFGAPPPKGRAKAFKIIGQIWIPKPLSKFKFTEQIQKYKTPRSLYLGEFFYSYLRTKAAPFSIACSLSGIRCAFFSPKLSFSCAIAVSGLTSFVSSR